MAKKNKINLEKVLEELEKTPITGYVCKKLSISRQTFYRWQKEDADFKNKVKKSIETGIESINDFCESKLLKKIQDENMQAIIFWLRHNKKRYSQKPFIINYPKN